MVLGTGPCPGSSYRLPNGATLTESHLRALPPALYQGKDEQCQEELICMHGSSGDQLQDRDMLVTADCK